MDIFISKSEEETIGIGGEFAHRLNPGSVVALYGELGAGKTQFVKGVCRTLDVGELVNSPTFTIVNEYHGTLPAGTGGPARRNVQVFHIDLYRLNGIDEITNIGFNEYVESEGICLIEWAEKLGRLIPEERFDVKMSAIDEATREIAVSFIAGGD